MNRAYENIMTRLRAVRRQWRWLIFSESALKCFAILALLMASTLIILTLSFQAWQFPFSRWIRIAILLLAIGGAIYAVIRTLILPLRGKFTDTAVAGGALNRHRLKRNSPPKTESSVLYKPSEKLNG